MRLIDRRSLPPTITITTDPWRGRGESSGHPIPGSSPRRTVRMGQRSLRRSYGSRQGSPLHSHRSSRDSGDDLWADRPLDLDPARVSHSPVSQSVRHPGGVAGSITISDPRVVGATPLRPVARKRAPHEGCFLTARRTVLLTGRVGRRDDLSDESDGAIHSRTGWDRVEKIDYIYPPGACGMHHRMVVGDLCIIPHLRRHFRDSGLVMCVSTLPSPSLSVPCIWGILQSPCRKSTAFSAKDHLTKVFVEIYYEQEQYYTSYPDMRRGGDRRHRRDA